MGDTPGQQNEISKPRPGKEAIGRQTACRIWQSIVPDQVFRVHDKRITVRTASGVSAPQSAAKKQEADDLLDAL